MTLWKQSRIPFLTLICGGVLLVLGKVILLPNADKLSKTRFVFPAEVPLSQWQLTKSNPLNQRTGDSNEPIPQWHYQYIKNNQAIDIEMRYVNIDNVRSLLSIYTQISSPTEVRYQKEVGYYGLLIHQKRAYLSACINPNGGSTFTDVQFRQNRYIHDFRPQRILPWLLGEQGLQDQRCLWAHLSVPLTNSGTETAYKVLEKTWFSWYHWWQPRFPKL